MPATLSYPGVYIEEIPSGVRTITGVATSITAFIGRARRGQTDTAITINSYGDFERIFGGLWAASMLGYAVRDFYLNGGSQAVIVRLYHAEEAEEEEGGEGEEEEEEEEGPSAKAQVTVGTFTLEAADEGKWGQYLRASVNQDDIPEDVAERLGVGKDDVFNLIVTDTGPGGSIEQFLNVTLKESPRRIDRVLKAESRLARWKEPDLDDDEAETPPIAPGDDAVTQAAEALAEAIEADPDADHSEETAALEAAREAMGGSDGDDLAVTDFLPTNGEADKKGLYALEQTDLFNLLCLPPYMPNGLKFDVDTSLLSAAASYCEDRRAFLIVDSPSSWTDKRNAVDDFRNDTFPGVRSKNGAIFFPRIVQPNLLRDGQPEEFAPCGVVAGVFARTDTQRGVWKAPAGIEAALVNVPELAVNLTDLENGDLNKIGVNCLRAFPVIGRVLWGARTLRGADQLADEWKYIPVRRTALFIEESLFRGTKWVVFEPNDEPLWAQIRLNVGAFMHGLFRQGAFQGRTPREAYFVKCDKETTTQNDINLGIVNIIVGFAPLKPAEFVVIKIQQMAGEIET